MWGAMMPTNPMGPQKAVTAPVIRQVAAMAPRRMRLTSAPESAA